MDIFLRISRNLKSASVVPRLPPLNRNLSLSMGAVNAVNAEKDERIDEMERMVASYQEKLDSVTNNYQEKVLKIGTTRHAGSSL